MPPSGLRFINKQRMIGAVSWFIAGLSYDLAAG
jgi:hypothetical protein